MTRRRERLAMRAVMRRISRVRSKPQVNPASGKISRPQYTLRKCGMVPVPRARSGGVVNPSGHVQIRVGTPDEGGRFGYVEGVAHCGSISSCPCCSAKIRNRRTEIYAASAARWLEDGNSLVMITLTFPHYAGMPLRPMWDMVSKGASHLTSSQKWRDLRKEVFGGQIWYRRALEQTYGVNGWHPHCHELLYIRGNLTAEALVALHQHFTSEWSRWVTRHGYGLPSGCHGVKLDICRSGTDAGSYIVKDQDGHSVGAELTRGDIKRGRGSWVPFDVLRAYGQAEDHGDTTEMEALKPLWWEHEEAAKGRRIITESRGLPKVLGEDEVTDQELADEEVEDHEDIGEITGAGWRKVCELGLEAPVFEAAARGGLVAVNLVLDSAGLDLAYPPLDDMRDGP